MDHTDDCAQRAVVNVIVGAQINVSNNPIGVFERLSAVIERNASIKEATVFD